MAKKDKKSKATNKAKTNNNTTAKPQARKKLVDPKRKQHRMAAIALFLLAFILYAYSITFGYVLDDQLYITSNQFTKQGFSGIDDILTKESLVGFWGQQKELLEGGRYRPLAIVTYAIEYQLFGEKPGLTHLINVLLYGLTALILFRVLRRLFRSEQNNKWYWGIPFITTALFVAHPLHSEVIANIKGRVEILALLFSLLTLWNSLRYIDTKQFKYLLFTALAFFLAMMSKESPITFLAVVPLTLYYFTDANLSDHIKALSPLLIVTAIFFFIRYQVLGYVLGSGEVVAQELLNDPFLNATTGEKYATVFYTLGLYVKLLFAPLVLTHDYYPKQIPIIGWGDLRAIASFALYAIMGLAALWGIYKKQAWAYGIAFYIITLSIVSNVVISIGTFMNERFLYIPSIGFCLIAALAIGRWLPDWLNKRSNDSQTTTASNIPTIALAAFGLLLSAYVVRTMIRVPAWESNRTLFLTDVENSPNSTKVNTSAGGVLLEGIENVKDQNQKRKRVTRAIKYLDKALVLYPSNPNALLLRGNAAVELDQDFDTALKYYSPLLDNNPNHPQVQKNISMIAEAADGKSVNKMISFIEQSIISRPGLNTSLPFDALGILYGRKKNDLANAARYFEQAITYPDADVGSYQDLAIVYGMSGDYEKALEVNFKALEKAPTNAKVLLNLSITYNNLGQTEKAQQYYQQALAIDPSLANRGR